MWGPKCEKVQKPWVLRLKHWILSMCVFDAGRAISNSITHSFLLKGEEPPMCISCDEHLTIKHFYLFRFH